jgi:ABC-type uncharacterized transport system ATPase subunit
MSALIGDIILRLAGDGIAVLLIEHDVALVERTCSRILCMATGQVIAEGTMQELRRNQEVLRAYLGTAPHRPPASKTAAGGAGEAAAHRGRAEL